MTISAETATGTTTLRLTGELDMLTAPVLNAALHEARADVVLDLSDVTFVDTTGLAVLVAHRQASRARGGRLRLERARPNVRRTFALAGLDDPLERWR